MRVTDKMNQANVLNNISRNRTEMNTLQSQAATLKRVTKPSDDPLATTRVLQARTEDRNFQQFQKNIASAKSFLEFTDQSLSELGEIVVRAKELAIQAANDSGGATPREIISAEIEQLYDQSIGVGNRRLGDRYIFAGFKTTQAPFDPEGNYLGDDGDMKIQTHKDTYVGMNIPGSKVFMGQGLSADGSIRTRSATPTTIPQVQEHKVKEQQRLEQKQEAEQNSIMLRGPASIGHTSGGSDRDPVTGFKGVNIFTALRDLNIAAKTNDKVAIQESLEILDQALNQVTMSRSEVGARVNALNTTFEGLQKSTVDNKVITSQLEDADMFQVVSDINKTDSTLKATMESSSKLLNQSLIDFLR